MSRAEEEEEEEGREEGEGGSRTFSTHIEATASDCPILQAL